MYGTLRPGEVRWHHLERFVVGEGIDTTVSGDVYDTGLGYPAAIFGGDNTVRGRLYQLSPVSAALEHLDEVEGAVRGLYRRVVIETSAQVQAWGYECGDPGLLVRRIVGGDWLGRDH